MLEPMHRSVRPPFDPRIHTLPATIRDFLGKNRVASERYVKDNDLRKGWLSNHWFVPEADACIDGRVLDLGDAIKMQVGLLELYRSGGSKTGLESLSYADRVLENVRKASCIHLWDTKRQMVKMHLCTAHYSQSQPDTSSCTAWDHQTGDALSAMRKHAQELNFAFIGKMVAFPALIDTDLDAIEFMGPRGTISVRELVADPAMLNGQRREKIVDLVRQAFPVTWEPINCLEAVYRDAFASELAERIDGNIDFVRNVLSTKRPIELLDHNEKMIVVGRHVDWMGPEDHNSIFLIDDAVERADVLDYFEIALKYVAKTVITRAILEKDYDWVVPVLVNIPHNDADDENVTIVYTRHLVDDLKCRLNAVADKVMLWLLNEEHGISCRIPSWVSTQIHDLRARVVFVTSRSYRKDRLFRIYE